MTTATVAIFDFTDGEWEDQEEPLPLTGSREPVRYGSKGGVYGRPVTSNNPKQIRQRARRKMKIGMDELATLYKPIDEWDMEELAKGRPKAKDGTFKGKTPMFLDRTIHEQIVKRFEEIVKGEMQAHTIGALSVIKEILDDDRVDDKGKPTTAAGTKLDAAKFLIEHIIGKPKQRTETDISVKLQGILGHAMVNPTGDGQYALAQGFVEATNWEDDDVEAD